MVHLDDFRNESVIRYRRGRESPEGFWLDSYDYAAVQRDVLEPLKATGHGRYRAASYDAVADRAVRSPRRQAAGDAIVLIEGMFLHRDHLAGVWDYSAPLCVKPLATERKPSR